MSDARREFKNAILNHIWRDRMSSLQAPLRHSKSDINTVKIMQCVDKTVACIFMQANIFPVYGEFIKCFLKTQHLFVSFHRDRKNTHIPNLKRDVRVFRFQILNCCPALPCLTFTFMFIVFVIVC